MVDFIASINSLTGIHFTQSITSWIEEAEAFIIFKCHNKALNEFEWLTSSSSLSLSESFSM